MSCPLQILLSQINLFLIYSRDLILLQREILLLPQELIVTLQKRKIKSNFFLSSNFKRTKLMPRPSARTKYFLSWTKLKLSKIKILSRVKKYIFCFQKSFKTKFPDWKSIFNNKYSFCMTFESKKCSF